MSIFSPEEIEYLKSQKLGRLATVNSKNQPQNAPVGFRYNPDLDVIEIGGMRMSQTQKYRNILKNPHVSFVVDDVLPPWKPRAVEIRGTAEAFPNGGQEIFGSNYAADETIIRIKPVKIISWGLGEHGTTRLNRKVS